MALFHAIHSLRRGDERSALGVPQGRAVDADRVALMPEPTEERFDERFVAKKRLPLGVIQIRGDNGGPSAVPFLHQLEEDVRLLGFEIEIAQLVDVQDVDANERIEKATGRAVREGRIHLVEEILRPDEARAIPVWNGL